MDFRIWSSISCTVAFEASQRILSAVMWHPEQAATSSPCLSVCLSPVCLSALRLQNAGRPETGERGSARHGVPLQAHLKRLKRVHSTAAAPSMCHVTASRVQVHPRGGNSRRVEQGKQKGLSKQGQRRYDADTDTQLVTVCVSLHHMLTSAWQ